MIVKAIPKSPKSSGTSKRASTTDRAKRINSPMSADDKIQLRPERTLFRSGNLGVAVWSVIVSGEKALGGRDGFIRQSLKQNSALDL